MLLTCQPETRKNGSAHEFVEANGKIRLDGFRIRARSASTALSTVIIYRRTSRSLAFVSSLVVDEVLFRLG